MIRRLSHVAIAVPDLQEATKRYRDGLGTEVSEPLVLPDHGVTSAFIDLENTKIELLEPLGEESPIAGFLRRNPGGGIHHVCLEVDDIQSASNQLRRNGVRILGANDPKAGAHGNPVIFIHPKDFMGTLLELEQVGGKRTKR